MVRIVFPAAAATGVLQDRTALPSTITVQLPHWAIPQPNFVPVRPTVSRMPKAGAFVDHVDRVIWPLILSVIDINFLP